MPVSRSLLFMTRDVAGGKIRFLVDMINGYPGSVLQGAYFSMRAWAPGESRCGGARLQG